MRSEVKVSKLVVDHRKATVVVFLQFLEKMKQKCDLHEFPLTVRKNNAV